MFYNMCFVCLEQNKFIKSILLQDTDSVLIKDKLKYIFLEFENFNLNIAKNICIDCLKNVNFVYKFKQKFLRNLMELSDKYEKQTVKIESTPDYNEYQMIPEYNTELRDKTIYLNTEQQENCEERNELKGDQEAEIKTDYIQLHHEVYIKEEPLYLDETQTVLKDTAEVDIQNETTNIADDFEDTISPDIQELADQAELRLIPKKSKEAYCKEYDKFILWMRNKNSNEVNETVLLAYMMEMSKVYKPSTLWCIHSKLLAMLKAKNGVDLTSFQKLQAFMKKINKTLQAKKSYVFSKEELHKFFVQAPDYSFLFLKIVAICGVFGSCKRYEMCNLRLSDIKREGPALIINIRTSQTDQGRKFAVVDDTDIPYVQLFNKYLSLRPEKVSTDRVFLKYVNGECSRQVVGVNTFGKCPASIARFLNLPDFKNYTGHAFRRTSATILAKSGISANELKRHNAENLLWLQMKSPT